MSSGFRFPLSLLTSALLVSWPASAPAGDWPSWRGPLQSGVSLETGLPASTKDILWRVPYGGRSTPVILGGRVFGIDLAGKGVTEQERVFCLDLETGKPLWEHRFEVFHTDVPDSRVGWASLAADPETGYVYAHGVQGLFFCFDRDGRVVWSRSLTEEFGRISGYGGRTNTPIIDEDRVIINFLSSSFGAQAVGAHRFLAMDKRTGEVLWWSAPGGKPEDTTYSTPVVAVVDGQRLIVGGNADGGVYAIQSRTGEPVWGFLLSQRGMNTSPIVEGGRVFAAHSEENLDNTVMGRVVCYDARGKGDITKTGELWRRDGIEDGYASPLLHDGRLYAVSNSGTMYCLDAATGKEIWQETVGRVGKGSPVWADGRIYLAMANGTFEILADAGDRAKRLDSLSFDPGTGGVVELFGSPAVADGRVVFFTTRELICLGTRQARPHEVRYPALPAETPPAAGDRPALLLVRPAEVLLHPGESAHFRAIAYDARGQMLRSVEAQWSAAGPIGKLAPDATLTSAARGAIGEVSARFGTLEGKARVRVVSDLPITEDFESSKDGGVIGWWIGCTKAKYAIETRDGSKVLKKLADARGPIFNRSHAFITPPIAPGYTVQADVLGVKQGRRLGDVGLINSRYTLELFGSTKRLRFVSWVPGPRFEKRMDFPWDPDRWYTMKFRVDLEGSQAHLRAKVWPREEKEPAAWTLDAIDPQPNHEGSAGLYANSASPICFDNVRVQR